METTITTKKGTKLSVKTKSNPALGIDVEVPGVDIFHVAVPKVSDNMMTLGRIGGQIVKVEMDDENASEMMKFVNEVEKARKEKMEAREQREQEKFQEENKEAFQKAKKTGERQEISRYSYETSGSYVQIVTEVTYAMPDGSTITVKNQNH